MSYVVGETYVGMTAEDYDAVIAGGNETLNEWLRANMSQVAGGAYYIYNGEDEMEFIEVLQPYGADVYANYFAFLGSTWSVTGM